MCFFKKKVVLGKTPPVSSKEISTTDKQTLLSNIFPAIPQFITYSHILAHYDDIALFLAQDQTNKIPYVFPDYVCSHFAFRLMGEFSIPLWSEITFGIVWTNKHALNCILTDDLEFYFVEPQTDEIYKILPPEYGTSIRFIMI